MHAAFEAPTEIPPDAVREIVLTGGPCSGKSTALAFLTEQLTNRGYRVFTVPEAATMLITNGYQDVADILSRPDSQEFWDLECAILSLQTALSEQWLQNARNHYKATGQRCVVIKDRERADAIAYVGMDRWKRMIESIGQTVHDGRDSFDCVIHLVTAALGAEEFYTLANNEARMETVEEAQAIDHLTREGWHGAPHLAVVDNTVDFSEKLDRVLAIVLNVLGDPHPLEKERKFHVTQGMPSTADLEQAVAVDIVQYYLPRQSDDQPEERVRIRTVEGHVSYYHTVKQNIRPGVRVEKERILTARQADELLSQRDMNRNPVRKTRYCFTHGTHYMELDQYPSGLVTLEIEGVEPDETIDLPPWVGEAVDVTDDPSFSNYALSEKASK